MNRGLAPVMTSFSISEKSRSFSRFKTCLFWALPLLFLLFSGCETLSSRLARNAEALQTLPVEHQNSIRQGNIRVGFTPLGVYLAWGPPAHKAVTESSEGSLETWIYTVVRSDTYYRQERVYDSSLENWYYVDKPYRVHTEYVTKEAVFADGKVDSFTLYPTAKPYL